MKGGASRPVLDTLRSSFRLLGFVMILVVLLYLLSGFYAIGPDEVGFVLRFGRITGATAADRVKTPGLSYALPYPFEEVVKIPVKRQMQLNLDTFWPGDAAPDAEEQETIDPVTEGYCITGDRNIIQLRIVVKYQISDPEKYLYNSLNVDEVVRSAGCAEIVRNVGGTGVDSVLTRGKEELAIRIREGMQQRLDEIDAGIRLARVELPEIMPPRSVLADFEAVTSERIGMETRIEEALSYQKGEVFRAEGEKELMLSRADAYAVQQIEKARGESTTFLSLAKEVRDSPRVIKARLYREAMEQVFQGIGSTIFIPPGQKEAVRIFVAPKKE